MSGGGGGGVTLLSISRCNVARTAAVRSKSYYVCTLLEPVTLAVKHIFLDVIFAQTGTFKVYIHLINIIY